MTLPLARARRVCEGRTAPARRFEVTGVRNAPFKELTVAVRAAFKLHRSSVRRLAVLQPRLEHENVPQVIVPRSLARQMLCPLFPHRFRP